MCVLVYFPLATMMKMSMISQELNEGHLSTYQGKLSSGFIYTMNVPKDFLQHVNYEVVFEQNKNMLQLLNGTSEFIISSDTYQFDDYSKYDASMFNEKHKSLVKAEQFPIDCQKAFAMGARLARV